MSETETEEAHVVHGEAWLFLDGRKSKHAVVSEFQDRIEWMGHVPYEGLQVGRIVKKPAATAWVVEMVETGGTVRVQLVSGCGCGGAPLVDWNA